MRELPIIDPYSHYSKKHIEFEYLNYSECQIEIKNIGWTLGNDCPYRCNHCYSMSARKKGQNMTKSIIDRIINQLSEIEVETVNLGGNEPIFTNGLKIEDTLLPYIIERLVEAKIEVGMTSSGVSLIKLYQLYPDHYNLLNDVDISLDSPFEDEHNKNRGAKLFKSAFEALEICSKTQKEHSIIMCAMNWNFSKKHIDELVKYAKRYNSNIRINPLKTVEPSHLGIKLTREQYYSGFSHLMSICKPIDLGEPPIAAVTNFEGAKGCPCGRTSFRIHSITPEGEIPVSPCVYLHDFKVGDLVKDSLFEIINSPEFRSFRIRNQNPQLIEECVNCDLLSSCRGGCTARGYLDGLHSHGVRDILTKDPYCPRDSSIPYTFPQNPVVDSEIKLVHRDYLCTWIGRPQ